MRSPADSFRSNPYLIAKRLVKPIFGVVAVALLIAAVVLRWSDFVEAVSRISGLALIGALGTALLANACNALSWRSAYEGLGMHMDLRTGFRVFYISQIGKYLPGSVWPVLAQMEMAREKGFARTRAFTASVVAMIVPVVTAGVISVVVIVSGDPANLASYWYVLAAVPIGIVVLTPSALARILAVLGRVTHRAFDSSGLSGRGIGKSVLWSTGTWVCYGVHSVIVLSSLTSDSFSPLLAMGAFAMSWVVGFLFIPAPAGVGVREAVLVLVLGASLSQSDALAFAIISRMILVLVDGVSALLGWGLRPGASRSEGPQGIDGD